jgi:hypothetical protein
MSKNKQSFHDRHFGIRILTGNLTRDAKKYIMANWQKVQDWTQLDQIVLVSPTGEDFYFYLPNRTFPGFEEEEGNPVVTLDEVGLDESDYDLSLRINNTMFWPIPWEIVVKIASYIENYLGDNNLVADEFVSTYDGPIAIGT